MVIRSGRSALRETDFANSYWTGAVLGAQLFVCAALLASILPAASFAGGIPCADNPDAICYGDFMGTTVWYRMVREEATTVGDSAPLFGMPTVAGNSLDFDPLGFAASSMDGGADITESNLQFMVEAKPGNFIQNIQFDEAGDTTLLGAAGEAFTSVTMDVFIDIEQVDGMGIDPIKLEEEMTFMPNGGAYSLTALGHPLFNTIWTGLLFVDIQQALIDANEPFVVGATKISVNLDNTLMALSVNGTSAVIAKKDNGLIVTTNIPEPASCLLAVFGLAVVAAVARRSPR